MAVAGIWAVWRSAKKRRKRVEAKLITVEAGVANFKQFQTEARDFFSRADEGGKERTRAEKKNSRRLDTLIAILSLIAAILLVAASFIGADIQSRHSLLQQLEAGSKTYQFGKFERTTK